MKTKTYLGIIGGISFLLASFQAAFIINFPMIGYLIFKAAGGSFSPGQFRDIIPPETYWFCGILYAISIGVFLLLLKED